MKQDNLIKFLEAEEPAITDEGDSSFVPQEENDQDIKSKAILKNLVMKHSKRLIKYKPGLVLSVSYSDQKEYEYKLSKRIGIWNEFPQFKPELKPEEILKSGVFEGKIVNDCFREFPREWFLSALEANKLSVLRPMRQFNYFGVIGMSLVDNWRDEDHDSVLDQVDPRGFFQWYCRFYLGRREPKVDRKQIMRWISFEKKFKKSIEQSCKKGDNRCKPRIKQSMISWGFDPKKM